MRTPQDWIEAAYGDRPSLRYFAADGCDVAATYDAALAAAAHVRERRAPAFLHLRMVRFLAHAGSDAEVGYRTPAELAADLTRDPLIGTARVLVAAGLLTPDDVLARYERTREVVAALAEDAVTHPKLRSAEQVMAPLAPRHPDRVAAAAARTAGDAARARVFDGKLPELHGPLTLADVDQPCDSPTHSRPDPPCWSSVRTSGARAGSTA